MTTTTSTDTLTPCSRCLVHLSPRQIWRGEWLEAFCHCCAVTAYPNVCRRCRGRGVLSRSETGETGPQVCPVCGGNGRITKTE
jgi:hypothetical protein